MVALDKNKHGRGYGAKEIVNVFFFNFFWKGLMQFLILIKHTLIWVAYKICSMIFCVS